VKALAFLSRMVAIPAIDDYNDLNIPIYPVFFLRKLKHGGTWILRPV
jgi:hypothetical protein